MAGSKGTSARVEKKKTSASKKRPEIEPMPEPPPSNKRRKSEPVNLPPRKRAAAAKRERTVVENEPEVEQETTAVETKKRSVNKKTGVQRSASVNVRMTHEPKRVKLEIQPRQNRGAGTLYVFGTNISGQFGFGFDVVDKRKYPALVPDLQEENILVKEVAAGGMHTVVLTQEGKVYTFGCNDDFALGRPSADEADNFEPQVVTLPEKVEQVSAGDSHTVVLTSSGVVYAWGTFRDGNGPMGLLPSPAAIHQKEPQRIELHGSRIGQKVIKVASGENHFLMLTEAGAVYSVGVSDVGQLGRRYLALRSNTLDQKDFSLTPMQISLYVKKTFTDIWVGGNSSFCKTDKGEVWVFGINSTHQLALHDGSRFIEVPTKSIELSSIEWKDIAVGVFHCVGLDKAGRVYSWGKFEDGRLGLGDGPTADVQAPTPIPALANETFVHVACGSSVSYAVSSTGKVYAWGFGENWQLGNGDDDDQNVPTLVLVSVKKEVAQGVIFASAGGQHACLIASKPFIDPK